jgi:hypothetical protein
VRTGSVPATTKSGLAQAIWSFHLTRFPWSPKRRLGPHNPLVAVRAPPAPQHKTAGKRSFNRLLAADSMAESGSTGSTLATLAWHKVCDKAGPAKPDKRQIESVRQRTLPNLTHPPKATPKQKPTNRPTEAAGNQCGCYCCFGKAMTCDNAAKALASGAVVLVFPGGDFDVYRPSVRENVIMTLPPTSSAGDCFLSMAERALGLGGDEG